MPKIFLNEALFPQIRPFGCIESMCSFSKTWGGTLRAIRCCILGLAVIVGLSVGVVAGTPTPDCPQTDTASQANCPKQDTSPKPKIEPRKESIVVTGTFEPMPVDSVDRSISVIDARESPLLYTHWVDYLQLDPSVDLQERAPDGVQADLTIRGSTFGQT
jgi:hypothetical protein